MKKSDIFFFLKLKYNEAIPVSCGDNVIIFPIQISYPKMWKRIKRNAFNSVTARSRLLHDFIKFHPEVEQALKMKIPVVALESTIISHGMPYPRKLIVYDSRLLVTSYLLYLFRVEMLTLRRPLRKEFGIMVLFLLRVL